MSYNYQLATKADMALLRADMDKLESRMTIKLGGIMVAGIGVLAALRIYG